MSATVSILAVLALLVATLNATATAVLYGKVYGDKSLMFGGVVGPTGPPGSGIGTGGRLTGLSDVLVIPPLSNGQTLIFSSTLSKWINRQATIPAATYSYGGSPVDPINPPSHQLTLSTAWAPVFGATGPPPLLSANNGAFPTPKFTLNPFSPSLVWNGPGTQLFMVHISLSANVSIAAMNYQVAIFVDDSVYHGSVGFMNFSRNDKTASYSYVTSVSLGLAQSIDFRIRQTATTVSQAATITMADMSLHGTVAM